VNPGIDSSPISTGDANVAKSGQQPTTISDSAIGSDIVNPSIYPPPTATGDAANAARQGYEYATMVGSIVGPNVVSPRINPPASSASVPKNTPGAPAVPMQGSMVSAGGAQAKVHGVPRHMDEASDEDDFPRASCVIGAGNCLRCI